MNRISKRLVSVLLAVLLTAGVTVSAQVTAFAEDDPYHATGYCGADTDKKTLRTFCLTTALSRFSAREL